MRKKKMIKLFNFIGALLFFSTVNAQNFSFNARVNAPDSNGLHSLLIAPEISLRSQTNLRDLRLKDSLGKEVPYVLVHQSDNYSTLKFLEYPVLKKENKPRKSTLVVMEQKEKTTDRVFLEFSNTSVNKTCTVSGSNDQVQWYAIAQNYSLIPVYEAGKTSSYCPVYFPPVAYRYLRILMNDSASEPLNLLRVGNFEGSTATGEMIDIPAAFKIEENPSDQKTVVNINFGGYQRMNRLELNISAPQLYKREARILVHKQRAIRKRIQEYDEIMHSFEITSGKPNIVNLPELNTNAFKIEIDNADNPPLTIDKVTCSQLAVHLVANLQAGMSYSLFTGDASLRAPQYDLASFVNVSPHRLPQVKVGPLTPIQKILANTVSEMPFWKSASFMWICIGLGGILIFFFAVGLLKDMKNK